MEFRDKTVVVTGAGAGIGRATAERFAELGASVVVNALDLPGHGGQETVDILRATGAEAVFAPGDVSSSADCEAVIAAAVEAFGGVDVLVNNAGVVVPGTVETIAAEALDLTLDVNVKGVFFMTRAVLPRLRARGGGVIVNTASVAALTGHTDRAAYAASKGAVVALTRSVAADHVGEGIRVNCVCPGTTLTPALQSKIDNAPDPAALEAEFVSRQPIGRLGRPEEIAEAIVFAASPRTGYMTGSALIIDGGMTM